MAGSIGAEPLAEYHYGGDVVTAFLLVAEYLIAPQEPARDPTWCGLEAARAKLAEGRPEGFGAQMERVLREAERAVTGR